MSLPQPSPRSSKSSPQLPVHVPSHRNRQVLANRRAQNRTKASQNMAIELGAMIGVNVFVAAIALITIIKLVPHNTTQQEQLKSLEAEVTALDNRVEALRKEFVQYFDPQQAQVNKRQLSDRLNADQRKLILTTPQPSEDKSSNLTPEAQDDNSDVLEIE